MTTSHPAPSASATSASGPDHTSYAVFGALSGLTGVAVLLQGLWAGIFIEHYNEKNENGHWLDVHSWGAHVTTVLGILTLIWAVWKLRSRADLWVGSLILAVLIVVEAYIGGRVVDHGQDSLLSAHVPIAMALMGLVVWLPLRSRKR